MDPAGTAKDGAERVWRDALFQFWQEQLERVKERLAGGIPKARKAAGDPGLRLDGDFWSSEEEELLAVLLPLIKGDVVDGVAIAAEVLEAEYGIVLDWSLSNAEAVEWARQYAAELVKGINGTTKEALKRSISSWLDTPGATMGDLYDEIEGLYPFGRSRAEGIAVTEVTRAYGEGKEKAYAEAGIPPRAYNEPAHPRGRCWTAAELLPNGEWVVVWRTSQDELVCKQPLETPWGTVMGCEDLDDRVVSVGPWLGMKLYDVIAAVAVD